MQSVIKNTRNSNIEFLRLIAMAMIVISHSSVHASFPLYDSVISFNNLFLDVIQLGNIGVDIFILISGYFLCNHVKLNCSSLLRLIAQVWFYSVLCYMLYLLTGGGFALKDLIPVILPTIFQEYWFFTVYVVLLLLSPYVNMFILNINQLALKKCIITMLLLWSIIPTFTSRMMYGNELFVFIMLYCIGAYIKIYTSNNLKKYKISMTITSLGLLFLSSIIITLISGKIDFFSNYVNYFYSRTSILSICFSVGLFAIFVFAKARYNRIINLLGSSVFGIYLIHDNPFMRELIWNKWLDNAIFYDSVLLPLYIIVSVCLVYFVCSLIELFRKNCIEPFYLRFQRKFLNLS